MTNNERNERPAVFVKTDARMILKNFSGAEKQYNPKGNRNFGLIISPEEAESLESIGARVKWFEPKEPGDIATPWIKVKVSFNVVPPVVYTVTKKKGGSKKTYLTEDDIGILDVSEIKNAHVAIRPSQWSTGRDSGVSFYLKTLRVEIETDEFAYMDEDEEFMEEE